MQQFGFPEHLFVCFHSYRGALCHNQYKMTMFFHAHSPFKLIFRDLFTPLARIWFQKYCRVISRFGSMLGKLNVKNLIDGLQLTAAKGGNVSLMRQYQLNERQAVEPQLRSGSSQILIIKNSVYC